MKILSLFFTLLLTTSTCFVFGMEKNNNEDNNDDNNPKIIQSIKNNLNYLNNLPKNENEDENGKLVQSIENNFHMLTKKEQNLNLFEAVNNGDTQLLRDLITQGADITFTVKNKTPLQAAALFKDTMCVKILLEAAFTKIFLMSDKSDNKLVEFINKLMHKGKFDTECLGGVSMLLLTLAQSYTCPQDKINSTLVDVLTGCLQNEMIKIELVSDLISEYISA